MAGIAYDKIRAWIEQTISQFPNTKWQPAQRAINRIGFTHDYRRGLRQGRANAQHGQIQITHRADQNIRFLFGNTVSKAKQSGSKTGRAKINQPN
jgi:hypothetical protein